MPSEVTVIVKNEEKRQSKNHLIYDDYQVKEDDPLLKDLMDQAVKEFNDEVEKVEVKIKMVVK